MRNSEDVNKYYKLINEYIDDYLGNWKVNPKNLKKYLNTNRIANFLEKKGLNGIKNINRVIDDIIQDRIYFEDEKVMKFENYIFESIENESIDINQCLHRGINKSNIEHEKIIADHYDVSLSEIDILDSNTHKFKIENDEFIIYKEDEIEIIKENLKEWAIKNILEREIVVDIGGKEIKLLMSKLVDNKLVEETISNEIKEVKWIIGKILKCKEVNNTGKYFLGIL